MKIPRIKTLTIGFFIFILLVFVSSLYVNNENYENKTADHIENVRDNMVSSVRGVIGTYEEFSNFIFNTEINTPKIRSIILEANKSEGEEKNKLRKELYGELVGIYSNLIEYNFNRIHFRLEDGESFLRLHEPDKYGGNEFQLKRSLRRYNIPELVVMYEEGDFYTGYNFIRPLKGDVYVKGSVEISISPESIVEELYKSDIDRDIGIILKKELVEGKSNKYQESYMSDKYMDDSEVYKISDNSSKSLRLYEDIPFKSYIKSKLKSQIEYGESFTQLVKFNGNNYIAVFESITDINDNHAGYLYSISYDSVINSINIDKSTMHYLITFVTFIIILMYIRIIQIEGSVRQMAITDPLTKAYNRLAFLDLAEKYDDKGKRQGFKNSVVMVDIDKFKNINDTYGHIVGDSVLKELVQVISNSIRSYDILARLGGEEFVLMITEADIETAHMVAERIRHNVEKFEFSVVAHITVSVGVVEKGIEENIQSAIDRADKALYESKETGRNKVTRG